MMTTSIVTMNSLFRHNAHQQIPMTVTQQTRQVAEMTKNTGRSHTSSFRVKNLCSLKTTVRPFPTKYHLQSLSFKNLKKKTEKKKRGSILIGNYQPIGPARTKRASVLIGNHQPIGSVRTKRASVLRNNHRLIGTTQTIRVSGILGSSSSNGSEERGPHSREHLQGHS